jgi:DNA-binding response OmpR family regulator
MKILVCDDDPAVISIIRFKLVRDGLAEVTSASNGRVAIDLLKTQVFDLIIADIHMPFHSGFEIVTFVRQSLKLQTPILILSAEGLEDTVLQAFDLGADDYVSKPFSLAELTLRVKRLLKNELA